MKQKEKQRSDVTGVLPGGRQQYQAYLLRVWSEPGSDGRCLRRFSLERIGSGHRQGFPNFDALVAYLEADCQQGNGIEINNML